MAQTEDCLRKCEGVGENAVMEAAGSGRSLTTTAVEVMSSANSFKRRKLNSDGDDQLVIRRYDVNSPATSENSDRAPLSRCSRTDSSECVKRDLRSVDPKAESNGERFETEISTVINCRFSRETTPSSEIFAESDELESSTAKKPSAAGLGRKQPEAKMPPAAEIEEFFSAAEKYDQKRFAEKYNYDVVEDVPLEGRYQWVRLKL
ncbi:cyclin-dependent kinase inhibitor family protein [Actinidia rufa]|uniref:Cyclin-dependent kinase inhibitor n=1 Tax=Actinidia rufa TaxID=165716 RepID=A0A7J0ESZ7_9ERIC|nr:cyclin-dependent kinase inhibitor family protein [Actinidia rufa]